MGHQLVWLAKAGEIVVTSLLNIFWLGIKELRSLFSDYIMVLLVIYAFTEAIYITATGTSSEVHNASIAFVDEDGSALSKELINAFYPPRFRLPELIDARKVEDAMDQGRFMFVVAIPPQFENDLRANRNPDIQLSIDATAMQQAGIGAGYIKSIINDRVANFLKRTDDSTAQPIRLVVRKLFNPNTISSWFSSVVAIINQITLLTVILTGAAVIREREHGTLEHLLVMPLNALEIALGQSMGQRTRYPGRHRNLALCHSHQSPRSPFRRLVCPVVLRCHPLSFLCYCARDLSWYNFAKHGPVCLADDPGCRRATDALGR